MANDNAELRKMVTEMLGETDKGFTDWEINFLDNMNRWLGDYTKPQADRIERIYKERM